MSEQIRLHERVATLESETDTLKDVTSAHAKHIAILDRTLTSLVGEVKQIRNALYAMVAMLSYGPGKEVVTAVLAALFKK